MANAKISELPAAGALTGNETVPVVQDTTTKKATLANVGAVTHAHSGTYERVYGVTAFTSAAIQSAIDVASAAGGGLVTGPAGTYAISATVTMKDRVVVDFGNIWSVQGGLSSAATLAANQTAVWEAANGLNADMVQFPATCNNAKLAGVALYGNKANQASGNGIRFVGTASLPRNGNQLERVFVSRAKGKGILVDADHLEVRMHEILVLESGGDGIDVEAPDCHLDFVLSGYNAGNGIVMGAGSGSSQLYGSDAFYNTLAGVVIKATIRTVGVQSNNNEREGLLLDDASKVSLVDYVLQNNGREFDTSAIRYAACRMNSAASGMANIAFLGVQFVGDGKESYAVEDTQATPFPAAFMGCSFAGTFATGLLELFTSHNVYGANGAQPDSIRPRAADKIGLTITGLSGQTADIFQAKTSGGSIVLGVGPDTLGFFNTASTTKKAITGLRNSGGGLASLLTQLAAYGLITDSSSGTTTVPSGVIAETYPRQNGVGSQAFLNASGKQSFVAVLLEAGQIVTTITFTSGGTAAVTPTNQWFSLYDASRNKLAVTADDTTTAWGTFAKKTLTIAAPFTILTTGIYYLGIMVAAGTVPSIGGVSVSAAVSLDAPAICGYDNTNTGLTAPAGAPATAAAFTALGATAYARVA